MSDDATTPPTAEQQLWQLWRQGQRPELAGFLRERPGLSAAEVAAAIGIDQYERWRLGERVSAEEYLTLLPAGPARDQAACDVIYGEYLLREQLGEHPDPDEYLARFPEQADLFSRQIEFHEAIAEERPQAPTSHAGAGRTLLGKKLVPQVLPAEPQVPGFEVLEEIGRGGMGVVYRARQLSLDRVVALKVLNLKTDAAGATDPTVLSRMRREAQNTARLSHPNIVTVYDAGLTGLSFYLAMEYVSGVDLHRLVTDRGPLPVLTACDYLRQAALGLQHAHEQGLVHRDIKPSNLIVSQPPEDGSPGVLKILDLGLARLVSARLGGDSESSEQAPITHDGAFMGTPDFIAPEQANDPRQADIRSDLYSLGCTFYYMLTGQTPFAAATPLAKLVQHHLKEATPVEVLRPDVPGTVSAIVRKLLAKRPEERYQKPSELARALHSLRPSRQTTPPPPTKGAALRTPGRSGLVRKLAGHGDRVKDVAFSPDGRWLASVSLDRTVRVWVAGGASVSPPFADTEAWRGEAQAGLSCLAFGPDGLTLVTGGEDRSLCLWDVTTRRPRWRVDGHTDNVDRVAFASADDRIVSSGHDGTLRVWDAATGQELHAWPAHVGPIWGMALASGGKVALTGGQDRALRLWDVTSGESLAALPEQAMLVTCVAISPDGGRALTGGIDGVVHVWDLQRRREVGTLEGHDMRVTSVAFSPDGARAVSGSRDQSVRVWDVATGRQRERFNGHARWVTAVAWAASGELIASGGLDRCVCLWQEAGE